jgi:hypothetical protein
VDWSTWQPGLPSAAALVRPTGGLRTLLDSRRILADDVLHTKLDRIGTALAKGLEQGLTPKETSKMLGDIIDDPQQALLIAQTETSRAVSIAARDEYQTAQVEQVEWLVAEGCDECQENADASPIGIDETFPSGDAEPPAHPNCMCAIAPVFDDSTLPAEGDVPQELSPEDFASASEDFATAAMAEDMYANLEPITEQQEIVDVLNQQRKAGYIPTPTQVDAVADYMSGSGMYSEVNTYLRTSQFDRFVSPAKQNEVLNIINQLDSVIKKAPTLQEPILTFRGVRGTKIENQFGNLKPGDTFTDNGFVSTSLNPAAANEFARIKQANAGYILEIINPQGTKGVFPLATRVEITPKFASPTSEQEWLLPKGTTFEVVEVKGRTIRMKVKQ